MTTSDWREKWVRVDLDPDTPLTYTAYAEDYSVLGTFYTKEEALQEVSRRANELSTTEARK